MSRPCRASILTPARSACLFMLLVAIAWYISKMLALDTNSLPQTSRYVISCEVNATVSYTHLTLPTIYSV